MVTTPVSTALVPLRGGQVDSAGDSQSRRAARARAEPFTTDEQAARQGPAASGQIGGRSAVADSLPLLRRRSDRGEGADPEIRIPPHLERRRAWREAFGLNTYHTQQLAQAEDDEPSPEATVAAVRAYRSTAWRGRLDLNLAQRISVTV